jgi:hypothetical protein
MSSFFDDVNNINIFGFTKSIVNVPKLKNDLEQDQATKNKFNYLLANREEIKIYYNQPLSQVEVDSINKIINDFVETSIVETLTNEQTLKSADGFDLYKFIIADINSRGGLGTIDGGINQYLGMTSIRHMLKDGFFEYAIRHFNTVLAASFSQEQINLYNEKMEKLALKYSGTTGTTQEILNLLKTAPANTV